MEDCTLCKEIKEYEDYKDLHRTMEVDEDGTIAYVKQTNEYNLLHDGGGDPFQAGICIQGISYCPCCGRKLNESNN